MILVGGWEWNNVMKMEKFAFNKWDMNNFEAHDNGNLQECTIMNMLGQKNCRVES